jgi:hypothetical protein
MALGFLTPDARLRVLSDLSVVLPGARLHTYVAGTPSTPLATYSDSALTIPNANPIIASAGGLFGPIYLTPGTAYKFVLGDTADVTIWTQDNVVLPASGLTAPVTVAQGGTGVLTLTAHGVLIGAGAGAIVSAGLGTVGQVLTSAGAGADPLFQTPLMTLLKAGSGSDANAGATVVDSIAISGLTALDTLRVITNLETTTQNTAVIGLYHVTDAIALVNVSAAPLATAAPVNSSETLLRQRNNNTASIVSLSQGMSAAPARIDYYTAQAVTTLWTAPWTLGLRHTGVVAGGTFRWQWAVYLLKGQ